MHASRAALMVIGVNLLAVWAAAAAGSHAAATGAVAPPQLVVDDAVGEARASLLAATDRLEAHARRAGVRPALQRDPFRFGALAGRRAAAGRVDTAVAADTAPEAAPSVAPEPEITLQGMAETGEGDTAVRTAILRAGGDLVLASLGTRVADRYEVVALTADSVEMEDLVAHVRRTWRLK